MAVFDWHEFAFDPAVREFGTLLREQFDLWVGFLDEHGVVVPVGDEEVDQTKPVCERLKVNSVVDADGQTRSCLASVQQWTEEAAGREDGERVRTQCHAGFGAVVEPVYDDQQTFAGAVYASGFLDDEDREGRERLRELFADNDWLSGIDEAAFDEVATLDGDGRVIVEAAVRRIAERVRDQIAEGAAEHDDVIEGDPPRFEGMIGDARVMRKLFDDVATVADSNSAVLIQGENGTGKELVARALHRRSRRANHRFVALNCAAIPGELIESELFGHKKGAFSGAHRDREGLCVEADRGTLFLDEIGDMERSLQSKLLRFLQNGAFTPVGSNESRSVDVRVICATNQDLEELVEAGEFRKDLYFRIRVVQLIVPPLRRRRGDIPLLIDHFLNRAAKEHGRPRPSVTEECRDRLLAHDWPGNVRELENEIERLVIMTGGDDEIGVESLSPRIDGEPSLEAFPAFEEMTLPEATEMLERKMILEGLRETGWNKTQTAEKLDVSRRNLIRKVQDYELEEYREDG